ncbi:HAMP domain-containing sensor histidine kinase [Sutterella sp. AM11-39]|uniref:ATP-binding response regulator n=1 Tax=Sutterella sp. AM11-39 TaxID=2292075 RepID=UPI0011C43901|nr:HAMP domain-containing sensor histidine kinase [Sutterella sp. AM11-39]
MKWLQSIKRLFTGMDAQQRPTARILSEQIHVSLRLLPVSLAGQIIGALGIAARFWPLVNHVMLVSWLVALTITVWLWARLRRRFLADTRREAHIREWLRQWMIQSVATGIVWGFAGVAFLITQDTMDIVVLVSVMVAVVFASWPAYSCWIPSLFAVMLLSLGPLTLGLTSALEIGQTALTVIVIVLICFVLYSGRRLSEVVVMAVTRDAQNERLVARLKSEKSRAESERRAVAAASERRAKFFAGANHDLRQPLQAMGIYLQILQMQSTPETKDVIAQLGATAQNISTLVEQLLEVSRIETGHLDVKMENVSVAELFAELAAEFAPVAASKGFFFLTRPLPLTVHTDPLFVKRILTNLITNAIRYSRKPGSKIVLAARRLRNGRITIGVYDQGPGISEEDRHRIFEAFYRGEAGKHSETGYGLGLSIVSGLAKRLGIPITVGSRLGRGSVFRLEFTSVKNAAADHAADGLPLTTDLDMRGVVGILEDNDIVRNAVSAIIHSWGATVVSSREPSQEFISRMVTEAQDGNLAALLSDYNLGEGVMTGLEAIFAVRIGAARNFPCVLLTAVSEDVIARAYRTLVLNPDNEGQAMPVILQKPAGAEALASALRRAVAENRKTTD